MTEGNNRGLHFITAITASLGIVTAGLLTATQRTTETRALETFTPEQVERAREYRMRNRLFAEADQNNNGVLETDAENNNYLASLEEYGLSRWQ